MISLLLTTDQLHLPNILLKWNKLDRNALIMDRFAWMSIFDYQTILFYCICFSCRSMYSVYFRERIEHTTSSTSTSTSRTVQQYNSTTVQQYNSTMSHSHSHSSVQVIRIKAGWQNTERNRWRDTMQIIHWGLFDSVALGASARWNGNGLNPHSLKTQPVSVLENIKKNIGDSAETTPHQRRTEGGKWGTQNTGWANTFGHVGKQLTGVKIQQIPGERINC